MRRLALFFFVLAASLVFAAAPDNLRAVYKVVPIPGGTAGQAGATGYAHTGVTLVSCSPGTFNGVGQVIDGCDFSGGQVKITGGSVTLKRSRVRDNNGGDTAGAAILITGGGPHLIEDVEIDTLDPNAAGCDAAENCRQDRTIGITGNSGKVTIRRVWAHNTTRGMDFTGQSNIEVVDTYHGPNVSPPIGELPGSCANSTERQHASAIRMAGGTSNILIRNTVLYIGECSWASGLIAAYPEQGANHDVTIDGGRWVIEGLNDGAYGVAVGCTNPESENYNFKVRNLQISTQHYSEGCPSGCGQSWGELAWTPSSAANEWTNVTAYNPGQPDHGTSITVPTPAGSTPGTCP